MMSQGQSLSFCVSERAVVLRLTLEAGYVKDVYSPCEVRFHFIGRCLIYLKVVEGFELLINGTVFT